MLFAKSHTEVAPKVRVGGISQDYATYFPEQKNNIDLVYQNPDDDQPNQVNYGPAFFESYYTLGDIKYLHGLNLHFLELGKEFNFALGKYRAVIYSLLDYANEWNAKSETVKAVVDKACFGRFSGFMALSLVFFDFIVNTAWTGEDLYRLGYD
ncbi:unnamed protein product [Penicillium salamii]|nr:unnamed protein product [Penicillium salamii]